MEYLKSYKMAILQPTPWLFELELLCSSFDDTLDLKVLQKELLHS